MELFLKRLDVSRGFEDEVSQNIELFYRIENFREEKLILDED